MIRKAKEIAFLTLAVALAGCAATETEKQFGNAVRDTLAQQRMQPAPAEDGVLSGDGTRVEGVIETYRTQVGDPNRVVNTQKVTKQE